MQDIRNVVNHDPSHEIVHKNSAPVKLKGPCAAVDYLEQVFGHNARGFYGVIGISMSKFNKTQRQGGNLLTGGYVWFPNASLPMPDHYHRVKATFPDTRNVLFFAYRKEHDEGPTLFPESEWDGFTEAWRVFGDQYENAVNPDRIKEQAKLGTDGVCLGGGPNAPHVVDFGVVINNLYSTEWVKEREIGVKFLGLDKFIHFRDERHKDFDAVKDQMPPEIRKIGELLQELVKALPEDKQEEIHSKVKKLQQLDASGKLDKILEEPDETDEDGNTIIDPDYFKRGRKPPTTH